MGAFALAYPDPFLQTNLFGFSLPSLLEQLYHSTQEGITCGNVLYVVDIIIPVLAKYVGGGWGKRRRMITMVTGNVSFMLSELVPLF